MRNKIALHNVKKYTYFFLIITEKITKYSRNLLEYA